MKLVDIEPMYMDGERGFDKNLDFCDYSDLDHWLDKQPIIDAEPVIHAHWEPQWYGDSTFGAMCSHCKQTILRYLNKPYEKWAYNYCPNCGAKMDGDEILNDNN